MLLLKSLFKRAYNTFHGCLKDNICFLHIPKCGGMSIRDAVSSCYRTLDIRKDLYLVSIEPVASSNVAKMIHQTNYPYNTNDDYPLLKIRKNLLLYFMNKKNTKYICGHFTFSEIAYRESYDKYAFITILRDPVSRWRSSYFFNRYKKADHRKIEDDITAHLQSAFGQSQGYEYVKFLGGADRDGDYTSRQAIERAKKNLHKFDIVGFLEYQDIFLEQFENRFGVRLNLDWKNQSPVSTSYRDSIILPEIEDKIKTICEPDREIYQYAIDNLLKANH